MEMNTTTVTLWTLANLSQSRELHYFFHIISSEDYDWLKQRPANQLCVHLSAILSGQENREKFFEEFQVN